MPIPRWDLKEGSEVESHPQGDYVEYWDHNDIVADLNQTITSLRKQIVAAREALQEEN